MPGIFAQQRQVVIVHFTGISPPNGKGNKIICGYLPWLPTGSQDGERAIFQPAIF